MHPEIYIQNAAPRQLNKSFVKLYFDSFPILVKCCADPKFLFIKSLTGQHFFCFCYFIFVIALSMPYLNLIKKYSHRKAICESNAYFMPKPL